MGGNGKIKTDSNDAVMYFNSKREAVRFSESFNLSSVLIQGRRIIREFHENQKENVKAGGKGLSNKEKAKAVAGLFDRQYDKDRSCQIKVTSVLNALEVMAVAVDNKIYDEDIIDSIFGKESWGDFLKTLKPFIDHFRIEDNDCFIELENFMKKKSHKNKKSS